MATHSLIANPVEVDPVQLNSVEARAESYKPTWSDWTPVQAGWMRRRPTVPGMNDHWGEWCLNRSHNQYFRFNPAANGTHIETAKEEFQFHLNDGSQFSVMPRDYDAGRTVAPEWWGSDPEQYTGDQGSTIIDESGDLVVFDPDEVGHQAVDIDRSGMEPERDERDLEGSTGAPYKSGRKHKKTTPRREPRGQRHRASHAITSDNSPLTSFITSIASTSDHAVVTSGSATETSNAIATWIFGTIMAGIGFGTMRATQKSADASKRSAVAGESSALSSRKSAVAAQKSAETGERSAQAAEESAQAGKKSAQAAENGVALMQKQLDFMIQDKRGPPPAGNSSGGPPADNNNGSGTGSGETRGPVVEVSREQPRARSVSTVTPPTVRTSTPSSAGMITVNISRPQAPTTDPGQSSVNQSPPKQGSSIRTGAMTLPKETTEQKEECLRNLTVVQDELNSRKKERESLLVLDRRLRELRNRLA